MEERAARRRCLTLLCTAFVVLLAVTQNGEVRAQVGEKLDSSRFVGIDELEPGLVCQALTVFRGTRIDTFDVEIIDVVRGYRADSDLILGRALGDRVEHTGIMQGMSGSPVYLDDRLIGALAFAWPFNKEPIAGIMPIADMLRGLARVEGSRGALSDDRGSGFASHASALATLDALDRLSGGELSRSRVWRLAVGDGICSGKITGDAAERTIATSAGAARPLTVPMIISSGEPTVTRLAQRLVAPLGFEVVSGGGAVRGGSQPSSPSAAESSSGAGDGTPALIPGSAVGVELVGGDIRITAIGTVTHTSADTVLAFGHPLFTAGPVEMPMVAARVHTSMPLMSISYKFASGGERVGAFIDDRRQGVSGRLGDVPPMIPVSMTVESGTVAGGGSRRRTYEFSTVTSPTYAPLFLSLAVAEAATESAWSSGPAGVELSVRAETDAGEIVYATSFHTDAMPYRIAGEVTALVDVLMTNDFEEREIRGLDVTARVTDGRRWAFIESVTPDGTRVRPGDALPVEIVLRDWQGETVSVRIELAIPDVTDEGPLFLRVGSVSDYDAWERDRLGAGYAPRSYERLVELVEQTLPENTVVVELLSPTPGMSVKGREMSGAPGRAVLALGAAGSGATTPAQMTVLAHREITHDRPVAGYHEIVINVEPDAR